MFHDIFEFVSDFIDIHEDVYFDVAFLKDFGAIKKGDKFRTVRVDLSN